MTRVEVNLKYFCSLAWMLRSLAGWLAVFRSAWSVKARMSSMWKAFQFRQYASSRHFTNELTILRAAQLFSILSPEHGGSAALRCPARLGLAGSGSRSSRCSRSSRSSTSRSSWSSKSLRTQAVHQKKKKTQAGLPSCSAISSFNSEFATAASHR